MEALKATPAEFVQDSLSKHVPLQGTAIVPPGMQAFGGRTMEYEEGADLMREADAQGGAYKRWDHIRYHDDDLKGKGEPFFSQDQARRGKQPAIAHSNGGTIYYEMQPTSPSSSRGHGHSSGGSKQKEGVTTRVRQRRASNGGGGSQQLSPGLVDDNAEGAEAEAGSSGLQRSNTGGKNIAQSLKRRFGSLRKKRAGEEAGY